MKTKELGCKETQGIQNIGIEDSQGNWKVEKSQVLENWENYITELHDRPNRPVNLEVEPEEEVDADEKGPYILQMKWKKPSRKWGIRRLQEMMMHLEMCSNYLEKVV